MSWEESIGLRQDRAKGGHLTHYRQVGTIRAICGFQPSYNRSVHRQMKRREGWTGRRGYSLCAACKEKADSIYRAHLLDEIGDPRI